MESIKILIVDDQKLFTESLSGVLKSIGDGLIADIRIASSGEGALKTLARYNPDLILLDIFMPGMNGLETLKILKTDYPDVKVLMLTTFGYDTYVKEAISLGATGYVLKDTTPQEVLASIVAVMEGQTVFSPAVVDSLSGIIRASQTRNSGIPEWFPLLTEKERKILLYISKGMSNEEIAEKLYLGKNTIRNYVSLLYDKLKVKDRFGAIRVAIEAQLHTLVAE